MIDESFSGLLRPNRVIALGRDDVAERPGDILLQLVSDFGPTGFRRLAEGAVDIDEPEIQTQAPPPVTVGRNLSRWFEDDQNEMDELALD